MHTVAIFGWFRVVCFTLRPVLLPHGTGIHVLSNSKHSIGVTPACNRSRADVSSKGFQFVNLGSASVQRSCYSFGQPAVFPTRFSLAEILPLRHGAILYKLFCYVETCREQFIRENAAQTYRCVPRAILDRRFRLLTFVSPAPPACATVKCI